MSENNIVDALAELKAGNRVGFTGLIHQELSDRINNYIDDIRVGVAKDMFGGQSEEKTNLDNKGEETNEVS